MKKTITVLIIVFSHSVIAQNVGIDTTTPNVDAALEIYSSNKGVILTRLPLTATNNTTPLSNHVEGMITYNTTNSAPQTANSVSEGLYYNDGTKWNLMGPNIALGDIKYSLAVADSKGWFLLDGRNITTLPAIAQYNATAMGFGTNLPDESGKFIKGNNGEESNGSSAGNNIITLLQSNLPNITYTATTNITGDHTHTYTDSYNNTEVLGLITNVLGLVPLFTEVVGANDSVPANLFATNSSGNHSHTITVPSGGSGITINATPKYLVTNVFVYLGE
ncbi:MAG: hypothetical protein ABI426_06595, partial [Flavobacterium sp.]